MKQEGLDLGRDLRDAGMNRTLDHQPVDWPVRYRVLAEQFIFYHPKNRTFSGEDLRSYVQSHGLEQPSHVNAWSAAAGQALRAWRKSGLIVEYGTGQSQRPEGHARLIRCYRKVGS